MHERHSSFLEGKEITSIANNGSDAKERGASRLGDPFFQRWTDD
jgi:hypothetical protein